MTAYEVHLYFDGPHFYDDAVITVQADSEHEAIREALAGAGLPRVAGVRELEDPAVTLAAEAAFRAALALDPTLGGKLHDVHGGPGQDCWCGYAGHDPPEGMMRDA